MFHKRTTFDKKPAELASSAGFLSSGRFDTCLTGRNDAVLLPLHGRQEAWISESLVH